MRAHALRGQPAAVRHAPARAVRPGTRPRPPSAIDATDSTYTSGRLGINTFNGTSEFQDVDVFIE
ncbi:hypothetical protein HW130_29870 [Streptomyces sp. PKU-EA00015]|uniref:hypothetical protein n=1 Tax=Streptomyces sp. PKU-EA00015 TaxID=2748326 RepID=UPI0015A2E859|nr:hypothetical protein [Streptomyces sp. PKU-EA00015]NWF30411.1 hypothetical protein [Streptomyces sp. PKU-EA00015]